MAKTLFEQVMDENDRQIAELKVARKVADAACKWFDVAEDDNAESKVWCALVDAIREYRKCCKNVADKKEDAGEASPSIELIARYDWL